MIFFQFACPSTKTKQIQEKNTQIVFAVCVFLLVQEKAVDMQTQKENLQGNKIEMHNTTRKDIRMIMSLTYSSERTFHVTGYCDLH